MFAAGQAFFVDCRSWFGYKNTLRMGKEMINQAYDTYLKDGVAEERRAFFFLFSSEDQKEGMEAFLEKRGYRIRETNYRCPEGEIDLVAEDNDCLVFVEVRTRTSLEFGSPEESITPTKRERLRAIASQYLQSHDNLPQLYRIDVVAVELDPKGKLSRIELIENAVEGT